MELEALKNKKILVLGFGKEGEDSYLALRKLFPKKVLGIADQSSDIRCQRIQKIKKARIYFGKDYLKAVGEYNLIIKTPGMPRKILKPFLRKGTKVTSQTKIFFDNFKGLIVGVTGTKGKGTTASLIYQILKKGGRKARLVGNIGTPVFQALLKASKKDIFVYELSSHQLQNLNKSPQIAVFLNLYPDHLEYYKNFTEYQKAKENIALHQKKEDYFIYNVNDKKVKQIAKKTPARKIPVSPKKPLTPYWRSLRACYRLKGDFNLLNLSAAVEVAKLLGLPEKAIKQAVKGFKGLPHRLEFTGTYKGIEFYNDSMSTIPEVTVAALSALGSKVKTLIVGGSEKGSNYSSLAQEILKKNLRTLIIFPGTGEKVWRRVQTRQGSQVNGFFADSMKEAVKIAYQQTSRGEICLLSPAAASFNLFQNYKERGNLFKKWVKYYGQSSPKK